MAAKLHKNPLKVYIRTQQIHKEVMVYRPRIYLRIFISKGRIKMTDLTDTNIGPLEKLLNIDEAANILNISKATLYTWICRKKIEVVKLSNRVMFNQEYLRDYIRKHTVKSLIS